MNKKYENKSKEEIEHIYKNNYAELCTCLQFRHTSGFQDGYKTEMRELSDKCAVLERIVYENQLANNEIEQWLFDAKMKWVKEHKQDRETLIATCTMNITELNEYHAKRKEVGE